jgi:hypothetical protein
MQDSTPAAVAALEVPYPNRESDIKKAINNILWEHGRRDITLEEADSIACRAFDIIMLACERKK